MKTLVRPLLLCFSALALALPAGASAATWSSLQLPGETARVALYGMSCPSASLCVASGADNTIASSTEPSGGATRWSVVHPGQGASLEAVNYRQVRGVSCPSPSLCVAVTFEGFVYTSTNPTGDASSWSVTDLDPSGPNTHLYGVSCPTADFCAAVAAGGKIVTSTDPTGGASAWTTTQLEGPLELRGVSCSSPAFCVAVGDNGGNIRPGPADEGRIFSSTDPLAGSWQQAQAPIDGNAYGVACPGADLCVSGDKYGNLLVSTAPSAPTSWRSVDGGGSVQITDVDCPSDGLCAAVDNNGDVLTSTRPSGDAGAWSFANLAPYSTEAEANALFGVSCPSASLCAIAANDGRIFTSTDPFAASAATTPPSPATQGKKKRRPRPKRPRVEIAGHVEPELELRGRLVTLPFRFFALHHAQVRRFLCRMDDRPLRPCHSPRLYRVGLGRHVFRVRAVGWTGLRGPVAREGFWTCHKDDRPGCGHGKTVIAPVPAA